MHTKFYERWKIYKIKNCTYILVLNAEQKYRNVSCLVEESPQLWVSNFCKIKGLEHDLNKKSVRSKNN